jgi:hypothetical protein
VEGERGAAWVEDGRLFTDGVARPPLEQPLIMELEELNARMMTDVLADLFSGRSDHSLDLAGHVRCLSVAEAVEHAIVSGARVTVEYTT